MKSFSFYPVSKSHDAVKEFFSESKIHEGLFMQLARYAHLIDSEIGVRLNSDIIGASTSSSAFAFYVAEGDESYEIKFKHLDYRVDFNMDDIPYLEEQCRKSIQFIKDNQISHGKASVKVIDKKHEETEKLLNMLREEYGFNGFYHYTDFSNLKEIITSGKLVCRNKAKGHFWDSADHDALERAPEWIGNQVRLFYFPKTPFLYKNEGIRPNATGVHMPRPIALVFDESVAYLDGIKYLDGSAINLTGEDRHHTDITKEANEAMNFRWDLITFRDAVPNPWNGVGPVYGEKDGRKITNCKNAEILLPLELDIKYLKNIVFRSTADYKQAEELLGKSELYKIDTDIFNNNYTYLDDYELECNQHKDVINISLHYHQKQSLCDYKHHVVIKEAGKVLSKADIVVDNISDSIELKGFKTADKVEYYIDNILCAEWGIDNGNN